MESASCNRQELFERLAEPFHPDEVKWKPQSVKNGKALAVAYIDARTVMDRLDWCLGVGNWQATYREAPDGVVCRLRIRIDGEWIEHEDFGTLSEQPEAGDRYKAAFSDALKRAAVHLGIARYLYRLPMRWLPYENYKWGQDPSRILIEEGAVPYEMQRQKPQQQQNNGQAERSPQQRVADFEAQLVKRGLCDQGELQRAIADEFGGQWPHAPIDQILGFCKSFQQQCQSQPA